MNKLLTATLTSAFLLLGAAKASALTVLYDGSAGNFPTNQGWFSNGTGSQSFSSGGTILDTNGSSGTDFSIRTGYARTPGLAPLGVSLDANSGFNLRFDLELLNEARNSAASNNTAVDNTDDRAGLSITVISSDASKAIELGFWTDRIWAQQDGAVKADPSTTNLNPPTPISPSGTRFTQAEGAAFNTQSSVNRYDLSFLGNSYFLYVNGDYSTPLLTGRLRDYRPEAAFGGVSAIYAAPNSVFIGDNTTSARGSFRLNQVEYSPTPVPFAFNPLLGFGVIGLTRLRKIIVKRAKR
ncbi:hypothetical protein H6F51_06035 [Cyanobacteria bacterium FACHB-DQ100]|uniref:choice-of-anchor Y domain-containing protein n=1 Tax=Leptolyngbya sp. DQ-M1 TaxID=2933920 RepID=UPI00198DA489|nr:hypothetical protein [Cyanobacteria bacterium FACHB-DQ100]